MIKNHTMAQASVGSRLAAQQEYLELTNKEVCTAVGINQESVLAMIKQGAIGLPLTMVPAFAAALELDAIDLLKAAMQESSPDLLAVIEDVFNPQRLTAAETNLIKHLRELAGDTPTAPIVFSRGVIALVTN